MTASVAREQEQIMQSWITPFHRDRFSGKGSNNMVELVEPEVERTDLEHTNILRWEDDGGPAIGYGHPFDHLKLEVPGVTIHQ
jgi:hypothetical protein